jgi:hypothetical protein
MERKGQRIEGLFGCDLRCVPFINPVTCPLTHQKKRTELRQLKRVCLGLITGITQTGWSQQRGQTPSSVTRERKKEELISTYCINYHLFNFINEFIN